MKPFHSPADVIRKGDVMLLKSRAARGQASLVDPRHVLGPEFALQHDTRVSFIWGLL